MKPDWTLTDLFTGEPTRVHEEKDATYDPPAAVPPGLNTLPGDPQTPFDAHWEEACAQCRACHLRNEGGRGPTGSTGDPQAPLMIVGEGPGGVEDEYGVPLVGPSGRLLDKALASVGITRDRVYVTNIVKCRPRGNRTPTLAEGRVCAERWLIREIQYVQPAAIIALGKVALRYFLGHEAGILRSRGKWIQWHGYPVMPTFHPAYLLRLTGAEEREAKWQVYYDLKAAKEKAAAARPDYRWQTEPAPDIRMPYETRRRQRLQAPGKE